MLGYAEMPKQAHLECELFVQENTRLQRLADIKNATITSMASSLANQLDDAASAAEPPPRANVIRGFLSPTKNGGCLRKEKETCSART